MANASRDGGWFRGTALFGDEWLKANKLKANKLIDALLMPPPKVQAVHHAKALRTKARAAMMDAMNAAMIGNAAKRRAKALEKRHIISKAMAAKKAISLSRPSPDPCVIELD